MRTTISSEIERKRRQYPSRFAGATMAKRKADAPDPQQLAKGTLKHARGPIAHRSPVEFEGDLAAAQIKHDITIQALQNAIDSGKLAHQSTTHIMTELTKDSENDPLRRRAEKDVCAEGTRSLSTFTAKIADGVKEAEASLVVEKDYSLC